MLLHGASYASLALVDVVALRPWGSPFFRLVHDHVEVFEQLPPAIHRGAVEAYVRGASHGGLSDEQLATLVRPWVGDEGQRALYAQMAQADERFEVRRNQIVFAPQLIPRRDPFWIFLHQR